MAEAFFRFGTDIEATANAIRSGMSRIERDLSRGIGGDLFEGFVGAAQDAATRARRALAAVGEGHFQKIQRGVQSGGGPAIAAEYEQIKRTALAEARTAAREQADLAGLTGNERRRAVDGVARAVVKQLDELRDEINRVLGRQLGQSAKDFAAGLDVVPRGRYATGQRAGTSLGATAANSRLPGADPGTFTSLTQRAERDKAAAQRLAAIQRDAYRANESIGAHDNAVQKSIDRQARKLRAEQERVGAAMAKAINEQIRINQEQARLAQVLADPTMQRAGRNRFTTATGVYRTSRNGLVEEQNAIRAEQARLDVETATERTRQNRLKEGRRSSLSQSFIGGLTSSGFGDNASGFDPNGLARSFGTTVKFSAQYEALQLLEAAFVDTIREAVEYRDSLTDLNLALGEGEKASAGYVDALSDISKYAGGNVAQALDAAARGVRAFTESGDSQAKKDQAGETSARLARDLSIITGQTIPDAMGDLVAIGQSFSIPLENLGQVTDAVAAAKSKGGDPFQIAQGLANAAVALNAAGFDTAEGAQLISAVIANLNETGQAAATRISRIVSSASGQSGRTLFSDLGIDPTQGAKGALVELARLQEQGKLTESQLARALNVLGGGSNLREFKATLDDLAGDVKGYTEGFDTAGKATDEIERKTANLAGQLKLLAGTVSNIQNELFDAGVFTPFLAALATLKPILSTVEALLKLFNQLAEVALPDFEIGGIGIQELLVGLGEIALARKIYLTLQRRSSEAALVESSLTKELAVEKAALARALSAEAAGAQTAARAHQMNIMNIERELAATAGLATAKGRLAAANAASNVTGLAPAVNLLPDERSRRLAATRETRRERGRRAVSDALGTGVGKAGAIGLAVVAATQAVLALKGTLERRSLANETGRNALDALGASTVAGDSADALLAAAEAKDKSSSGILGNIVDFFGKLPQKIGLNDDTFGVDDELDAKNLRRAARNEQEQRAARDAEDSARAGTLNRYDDIFGDINSLESLQNGFEQLDVMGASAATKMRLLAEALAAVGKGPGFIPAGSAGRKADEIRGELLDAVATGLEGSFSDWDLMRKAPGARQGVGNLETRVTNAEIKRQNEERRKNGEEELDWRDPEVRRQALGSVLQRERQRRAREALDTEKGRFGAANRSELLEEAAAMMEADITAAVGTGGGQLSNEQITAIATKQADFFIGNDEDLRSQRDQIITAIAAAISAKTDAGNAPMSPEIANALQSAGIGLASQAGQDIATLTGDVVAGAQRRVASLQETINSVGANPINDSIKAEQIRANQDLRKALDDRADSYDELAQAQLGSDDAVGAAALTYNTAVRAYWSAVAGGNIEQINRTLAETYRTAEAAIDAQVEQMNALAATSVRPNDAMGQALQSLNAANLVLANTTQFGADGKQTAAYSNALIDRDAKFAEAQNAANAEADLLLDRSTSNADVTGNLSNAVSKAGRALNTARQLGGVAEIAAAEEAYEDAVNAYGEGLLEQSIALQAASRRPLDALGKLADARNAAARRLAEARANGADAGTTARLEQDVAETGQAEHEGLVAARNAFALARIDPRDSVARSNELLRQARAHVADLKARGATGAQVGQALQAVIDGQIAAIEAVLAERAQRRRTSIDLTDPLAEARAARQDAEDRARTNRAAGAPRTVQDADNIALRQAQANEEQTAFQQRFEQAQTNERLGRISHTAYISYLNSEKARLEAIGRRTFQQQQQLNQIDEALKAAAESMQGQWNLGEIRVPSPFEARRALATQTGAGSQSITTVNLTINGGDLNAVRTVVSQYLGPVALFRTPTVTPTRI